MSTHRFSAKIWLYPGETGAWHFISLPISLAQKLHRVHDKQKRGWGSLPVEVTIGKTSWQTSIFPDKRSGTFLLPLKIAVRTKEECHEGDMVRVRLRVR